jgi:hypothetical protein
VVHLGSKTFSSLSTDVSRNESSPRMFSHIKIVSPIVLKREYCILNMITMKVHKKMIIKTDFLKQVTLTTTSTEVTSLILSHKSSPFQRSTRVLHHWGRGIGGGQFWNIFN